MYQFANNKIGIRFVREQRKNSKRGQPQGLVEIQKYQANFYNLCMLP